MIKGCLGLVVNVYYSGNQVRLWDCNGVDGQKWVMDGSEVKPKYTFDRGIGFCLDVINGINTSGRSILWGCNGTSPQNWRAGDNDFTNSYQARIYAYPNDNPFHIIGSKIIRSSSESGHVFVAIWQQTQDPFQSRGGYALKNTFAVWQNYDNNNNNFNRYNNIGDGDAIITDSEYDWRTASDYGRDEHNLQYRFKSAYISKSQADYLRFGNAHRNGINNQTRINTFVFYSGVYYWSYTGTNLDNCATFGSRLWNRILMDGGIGTTVSESFWPDVVYNSF